MTRPALTVRRFHLMMSGSILFDGEKIIVARFPGGACTTGPFRVRTEEIPFPVVYTHSSYHPMDQQASTSPP